MRRKKSDIENVQPVTNENNPTFSKMLISREKERVKLVDAHKISHGTFYTRGDTWLTRPVVSFISKIASTFKTALDPFAGDGHILEAIKKRFEVKTIGLDIANGKWEKNDSLVNIPKVPDAFICTNPPYLAKHSAARKGVLDRVEDYYGMYDDLYQVALARCFKAARYTVAIIPETFLNSSFPFEHLRMLCVIEDNPFGDTDQPILVAAFDSDIFDGSRNSDIYIGDEYCFKMSELQKYSFIPSKKHRIIFNDSQGRIALKAVDGTKPDDRIHFIKATGFFYARENIKVSSRLLTYLEIPGLRDTDINRLLEVANLKIEGIRRATRDLILSPFKGNNKAGRRRRRLDYRLARYILESSINEISSSPKERTLFEQ